MAPTTVTIPTKRALPSKESSLFRELLQFYETRQLKKGLKAADLILKKFPEHGETLCMKGLVLTHMGKREEGRELVKKGMRFDLTSHIVWHVFGLIQKGEKNYEEALKSYTQALRFDKENMNILRDAAHLQAQLRMYESLVETRHLLLKLRPNLRQNWIGLAVAYHLNGNLAEAKKVLEQYERTLKNVPDYDFEQSELMLYHVRILEEMGELPEALHLLDVNAKDRVILDRIAVMETRARILSVLGPADDAEHSWRSLIQQSPDCPYYYRGLLRTKEIELDSVSASDRAGALEILHDFSSQMPRADTPRRLALTVSSGDDFKSLVREHLVRGLTKGIPSLFTDTKSLYQDPSKRTVIEEMVEGFRETLRAGGSIGGAPVEVVDPGAPTTYLWTLYFLAQHYSYLGQQTRALPIVATALTHTPTLPDLYTLKGRILKRLGDLRRAANAVDDARLLDGQDRFLNTKSAKYRFRAGQIAEANDLLGLFTKKDAPSPGADLEDMQSLLYLTEEGQAQLRAGKLNLALKKFHAVQKVFDEIEDDQFDFHGYSMRKFTVNIYINMIRWADQLRSHPAYVSSALGASQIYVKVHDDPSLLKEDTGSGLLGALTEAQKKAKKKAKKAAQKFQAVEKKGASSASTNEDKGLEITPAKDEDPDGMKLLTDPQPLERAWKFLAPLTTLSKDNNDVWIAAYDVSVRRGKYLQAVKALNHVNKLDASHPELHSRLLHFRKAYAAPAEGPAGPIVIQAFEALLPAQFASETFNAQYLQQHGNSARGVLGAACGQRVLEAPLEALEGTLFGVVNEGVEMDIPTALAILGMLKEIGSTRAREFARACDAKFALSTVFKTPEELELVLKEELPVEEQAEIMA